MKVIPIVKESPVAWMLMPAILDRVKQFCVRYESDANINFLVDLVRQNFVCQEGGVLALAALKNDQLVGHALASVDEWCGVKFLTITQFEVDITPSRSLMEAGWEYIKAWGLSRGAKKVQIIARNEHLARVFRRYYGMRYHRLLMRGNL